MKPLNSSLLARCDLPLAIRDHASSPGSRPSRRPGGGAEAHAVRPYNQGDDPRRIDWNASARTGELQVHTTLADVAVDVHLLPSAAATMRFGTNNRKHDKASEVLRFIAALAARRSDQVFLHLEQTGHVRLPGRHATALVEQHLTEPPAWGATDSLVNTLRELGPAQAPTLLVVVVDLYTSDAVLTELRAQSLARDIMVVLIHDPAELTLPSAGLVTLCDPTTGQRVRLDTSNPLLAKRYRDAAAKRRQRILDAVANHFVLEVSTAEEVDAVMARRLPRRR